MDRANTLVHCPLCGMEFDEKDTSCAHGCPLGSTCDLLRCPNCDYEFPAASKALSWLRRMFSRAPKHRRPPNGSKLALDRMRSGERGRLLALNCKDPKRRNTLAVFGLTPGTEIVLVQRRPSYVIRVGETELGLDQEIAREIVVQLI